MLNGIPVVAIAALAFVYGNQQDRVDIKNPKANQDVKTWIIESLNRESLPTKNKTELCQLVSVHNSWFRIEYYGTEQVRAKGKTVLPDLLAIMKKETTSFDSFAKCYSIVNQILADEKIKNRLRWYGGQPSFEFRRNGFIFIKPMLSDNDSRKTRALIFKPLAKFLSETDLSRREDDFHE